MNDEQKRKLAEAKLNSRRSMNNKMQRLEEFKFVAPELEESMAKLADILEIRDWTIDLTPLYEKLEQFESFKGIVGELKEKIERLPTEYPEPLDQIKVTNLGELKALITGHRKELIALIKANKFDPASLKSVVDAVNNLSRNLEANLADPKQAPDQFTPFRRVREVLPGKFIYDDSSWSGSAGGGGTSSSSSGSDITASGSALTATGSSLDVNITGGSSAGTEYTEDAVSPADPAGGTLMMTRDDQLGTVTEAEGDWSRARGTSKGALWVALADSSGDPITSFGGGTQYTEGDTDATITGTALVFEGAANTLVAATGDATNGLDVDVTRSALPSGASTAANQTTIIGHVDGIEGLLGTIDADTGNISTKIDTVATDTTAIAASASVLDDWDESDRAKVNPIAGQAGVQGASGTVTALTQRVVLATDVALPAGTNAIGKLAANSGVDIGDVDVTSSALPTGASTAAKQPALGTAGSASTDVITIQGIASMTKLLVTPDANSAVNVAQINGVTPLMGAGNTGTGSPRVTIATDQAAVKVTQTPAATGGLSTMMATSADGSTALTSTAQAIKASAGQLFGWYIFNPNSVIAYVNIYNTASGSVTVGTTNPLTMLAIPPSSAANAFSDNGIAFGTAIAVAAVMTTAGGTTAPTVALEANFYYS